MIKELVNFAEKIDDRFKSLGSIPKEGLHILIPVELNEEGDIIKYHFKDYKSEIYSKKQKKAVSEFLDECKIRHQNAWCINTNKCFDLPIKAIHSCSPYCVAFKKEHLKGGDKYNENEKKGKPQIQKRFATYFSKSFELLDESKHEPLKQYEHFFVDDTFSKLLEEIKTYNAGQRTVIDSDIKSLKEQISTTKDKDKKNSLKERLAEHEQELISYKEIEASDYIIFYLDVPLEQYKQAHKKYLDDKLFVNDKYNTKVDDDIILGASNFLNTLNSKMPFLMHKTSTFDISGRISNLDAKQLYDLEGVFRNKTLPNPLPIFIHEEELQNKIISIFQAGGFKIAYQEIITKLLQDYNQDIANYYLLYWYNTTKGVVFRDFDFVSRFEYLIEVQIENYFGIKNKENKELKQYPKIHDIFEFEQLVFKTLLQNKFLRLDYFGELKKDDYEKKDLTFMSYTKYRKAVYDYVYKSQHQVIDGYIFDEMVFNAIKDDIKQGSSVATKDVPKFLYSVKDKLNIWYSLYNFFRTKNKKDMSSKLKDYQNFVDNLIEEQVSENEISDKAFAFLAGQVIYYTLTKSKSDDNSLRLLEPYLQKSKCSAFKQAIADDIARYKHENFSNKFHKAAAFVLSYETDANIKHLLPELLSGLFSDNKLFSDKK